MYQRKYTVFILEVISNGIFLQCCTSCTQDINVRACIADTTLLFYAGSFCVGLVSKPVFSGSPWFENQLVSDYKLRGPYEHYAMRTTPSLPPRPPKTQVLTLCYRILLAYVSYVKSIYRKRPMLFCCRLISLHYRDGKRRGSNEKGTCD